MPTQLSVYNSALGLLGQGPLTTVSTANENTRVLNSHWDTVVNRCHEKTAWDHAKVRRELARLEATPEFGYEYYYAVPSDCLRWLKLSQSGAEGDDLQDFEHENGRIATNASTVYMLYVSENARTNPGRWSDTFAHYVACELAFLAMGKINSSAAELVTRERKKALSDAVGLDATQGAVRQRRHGAWSRAARGYLTNVDREQK